MCAAAGVTDSHALGTGKNGPINRVLDSPFINFPTFLHLSDLEVYLTF